MKKTFKKIIICLVVIGLVFFTTPFLIKTKADSSNNLSVPVDYGIHSFSYTYYSGYYTLKYQPITIDGLTYSSYRYDLYINSDIGFDLESISEGITIRYLENFENTLIYPVVYRYVDSNYFYSDYTITTEETFDQFHYYLYYLDQHNIYYNTYSIELNDLENHHINETNNIMFTGYNLMNSIYSDGFDDGETLGYSSGYQEGQTNTITTTSATAWISNIGEGVGNILAIPIFGQITLGTLVFIPIAMGVVLWLLYVWRRN